MTDSNLPTVSDLVANEANYTGKSITVSDDQGFTFSGTLTETAAGDLPDSVILRTSGGDSLKVIGVDRQNSLSVVVN